MIQKLLEPEVQKFIKDHQLDDPFLLSLNTKKSNNFPLNEAIEQIQSRQKAKGKLPTWLDKEGLIFPPPVSVEQSSSEVTAEFKAGLIGGESCVDLTGGMGVDSSLFAQHFKEVHYVEADEELCQRAGHNFDRLGIINILVHHKAAEDFLKNIEQKLDVIYLDPSRRVKGRKTFRIEDFSPNPYDIIPKCKSFSNQVLVKLSPLVDISFLIQEFQPIYIWVIALKNEVKEVLCLIKNETSPTRTKAIDLDVNGEIISEFSFFRAEESESKSEFSLHLKYLYEPNSAILKAGPFKLIGKHYKLKKLHRHSHLYTSDELVEYFPGKTFLIKEALTQNEKKVHKLFPDKKVNVITRNYPLSANQLKSKFGLKDGGDQFLIGTTLKDGKKVLLMCAQVRPIAR